MPVLPNQPLSNPINSSSSIGAQIGQAASIGIQSAVGLNPMMSRQNVNSMFSYSTQGPTAIVSYPQASYDWRVRVSLPAGATYFYNDPSNTILNPLVSESSNNLTSMMAQMASSLIGTKGQARVGVVFPYTPSVTVTHTANYSPVDLVHNNYKQYSYQSSEVSAISVAGEFTVQNVNEGQYLLATIYFFRALTKMFFGADTTYAGNPPPIVYLNGYGQYYLPNVPCVVTSFTHTMPPDCDYVEIPEPGLSGQYIPYLKDPILNTTRLPTTSTISISLQPMYSRLGQSQGFNLQDFAKGALINAPGSGMPSSSYGASVKPTNGGVQNNGGFL
jgi:hypothetical protein